MNIHYELGGESIVLKERKVSRIVNRKKCDSKFRQECTGKADIRNGSPYLGKKLVDG